VDRNAAEDVDPPRLKSGEIQPLDREQTRTLLQAAEGDRLHALYVVAVTAGLRPVRCWRYAGVMWTLRPVRCG
jgi:hypothetical protein